jgi:hypothetical protein
MQMGCFLMQKMTSKARCLPKTMLVAINDGTKPNNTRKRIEAMAWNGNSKQL